MTVSWESSVHVSYTTLQMLGFCRKMTRLRPERQRKSAHICSRTHPASISIAAGYFYPGIRRSGREVHQVPPSSTEYNKVWDYKSTGSHVFVAYTETTLTSISPVPTNCSSEFYSPLRAVVWLLILHLHYTRLLTILLAVEVKVRIRN